MNSNLPLERNLVGINDELYWLRLWENLLANVLLVLFKAVRKVLTLELVYLGYSHLVKNYGFGT